MVWHEQNRMRVTYRSDQQVTHLDLTLEIDMKVLITGGAGYLGTELVKLLTKNEAVSEIVVYDNLSRHNFNLFLGHKMENHPKVQLVVGDILDSRLLKKQLQGVSVVYHLAAKVTTPFSNIDPHFFEQVNHWGTAELVYAIEESEVRKVIYTSSTSVYGASKQFVNEDSIPNPRTFYGISKMRGEEHIMRLNDRMDTYILRCGNVYGYSRSMRFDAVINKFVFEANFKRRISINGKGNQSRSFIHIDKITRVLEDVIFSEAPSGIYNVVGKNLTVLDIVDVLKEIYPDLEFNFVNQHLKLREINVDPQSKLEAYLSIPHDGDLKQDLINFSNRFSF